MTRMPDKTRERFGPQYAARREKILANQKIRITMTLTTGELSLRIQKKTRPLQ